MIQLTRLDGSVVTINADLIETIEERPNTIITLTTEKRFVVQESAQDVVERVVAYRQMTSRPRLVLMPEDEEGKADDGSPLEFPRPGRMPGASEEGF
ncbi:MAG: flagellar FlbD family protein [Thermomicrobiales bacterium]